VNRITALRLCLPACAEIFCVWREDTTVVEEEEGFWGSRGCVGSRALSAETVASR
jgi:hypothetical protein